MLERVGGPPFGLAFQAGSPSFGVYTTGFCLGAYGGACTTVEPSYDEVLAHKLMLWICRLLWPQVLGPHCLALRLALTKPGGSWSHLSSTWCLLQRCS
jgi:hypothetical protein